MIRLRIVLLAVALVAFVAVSWRLGEGGGGGAGRIAAGPTVPAVPAPRTPDVAPPPSPALPTPAVPPTAPQPLPAPAAAPAEPAPARAPAGSTEPGRAAVLATIEAAPDLARAFALIRAEFPAVAERAVAAAVEASGKAAAPSADEIVAGAMRDLRLSAGVLAARAGPDALAALFDAKAATLADLEAADPRMCADYVFGATSPEFADFAIAHRALVARQDIATVAAMADGRTRRMRWDAPSPADYAGLEGALEARGLSPVEIAAVLDGKSPEPPLTDARVCANARLYLEAMRSMPAEARNRIYGLAAELLARS